MILRMNMTTRRPLWTGLRSWASAVAAVLVLGAACAGCGGASPTGGGAAAPSGPPLTPPATKPPHPAVFAPYLEVGASTVSNLAGIAEAAHADTIDLAFIVDKGGCVPGWDGAGPFQDPTVVSQVNAFRAAGGSVAIAFGGAEGRELANGCKSVSSLVGAYQKVIDAYGLTDIDLDVEGSTLSDTASMRRRNQALASLQKAAKANGKTLNVTFTLPTDVDGPADRVATLLRDAASAGVQVSSVNIMAMDFGSEIGDMLTPVASAAKAAQAMLKRTWPDLSDQDAWQLLGVTVMIGTNDDDGETISTQDAQRLVSFVKSQHIGRVAFWSLGRDRPCEESTQRGAPTCSGVAQQNYAFGHIFGTARG